jgi:CDP-diacylglycerol--serine O-phosphatidyltransferase
MEDLEHNSRPPRRPGIYLLPNLLTTGALFAGFYGIVGAIDGNYQRSAIALFVAMLLDGLDGRLARLTGTESEFGKQYDSLSDLVAFGVAPAIIVYQWGLVRLAEFGWAWGKLGWLAAFLYAVAAALRLARFNVSHKSTDRRFFEGLPSPSAAALVVSMVWLGTELGWSGPLALAVACALTTVAGMLMVSKVAYYSFKEVSPRGRISFTYVFVIPLTFVLIALNPPLVLFALTVGYVSFGPIMGVWRWYRRRQRRRDETGATNP